MGENQQLEKRIKDMEMIGYAIGYKAGHTQSRNERDRLNAQHFTPGDAAP